MGERISGYALFDPAAPKQALTSTIEDRAPVPYDEGNETIRRNFTEEYALPVNLNQAHAGNHLFIFLDGTWNEERSERGRAQPTNVLRMFEEMRKNESELTGNRSEGGKIVARYYRGIGSRQDNNVVNRMWFGFSGKDEERIRAAAFSGLYRDYQSEKDSIYILGFSRGAACARLLARDLCIAGLPPKLRVHVTRFPNLLTGQIEARVVRCEKIGEQKDTKTNHKPKVVFLGCWDTVDAFTVPSRYPNDNLFKKMWRGFKKCTWPRVFWEDRLEEGEIPQEVGRAIHCVAIDETRNAFLPSLMVNASNVGEVWFPGVHADVGGGYNENSLAEAPYKFMKARLIETATAMGLQNTSLFEDAALGLEKGRPRVEYCFHFHGMNTDIEQMKDIVGFGKDERTIRVLTKQNDASSSERNALMPNLHVSTLRIMKSGSVFASDRRDKRVWSVKYDPYNVAKLKNNFTWVDENKKPNSTPNATVSRNLNL